MSTSPCLFIDGPAHGRVIQVTEGVLTWVVVDLSPSTEVDVRTQFADNKQTVYCTGVYRLAQPRPWDPEVYLRVATPHGAEPTWSSRDIERLARNTNFKDTDGRPV